MASPLERTFISVHIGVKNCFALDYQETILFVSYPTFGGVKSSGERQHLGKGIKAA